MSVWKKDKNVKSVCVCVCVRECSTHFVPISVYIEVETDAFEELLVTARH